uniref:F-box domain-containing protein n=1 Tax=Pundamilia nyererei TaxID=303518 RepID=A0A3B4FY89_9CICH
MAEKESEISRSFPQTQNKWNQPVLERLQQGRGKGRPGPRRPSRRQTGGRRWPTSESPNQRQCGGNEMPSEILHKILSYLDVSSLFCISHVSKLFYQLTNDDVLWYRIYMSEFGWKPKAAGNVAVKMEPAEDQSTSCWKWMYFRMITGREMNKWRGELRDIGPFTGLPQQTEWVLRYEPLPLQVIPKVFLLAWRSLILNLDMRTHPYELTGKDGQIRLACLSPGVVIGFWRGRGNIAFIMINLHFHKLVEKILLGSPNCCVMTLTLLDEFQKPFWCVSTPVTISVVKKSQSLGYSGTNFLMVYRSSEGQVKMKLVRLKEQQQFFLVSLTLYVSILKVNAHFSTKYKS